MLWENWRSFVTELRKPPSKFWWVEKNIYIWTILPCYLSAIETSMWKFHTHAKTYELQCTVVFACICKHGTGKEEPGWNMKQQKGTSLTGATVLGCWQAVQMVSSIAVGLHVGSLPESLEYWLPGWVVRLNSASPVRSSTNMKAAFLLSNRSSATAARPGLGWTWT